MLVAALGKSAAKISVDSRYIKASFSYKGGFKVEMDEICPKTNPQRLRFGAVFPMKGRLWAAITIKNTSDETENRSVNEM